MLFSCLLKNNTINIYSIDHFAIILSLLMVLAVFLDLGRILRADLVQDISCYLVDSSVECVNMSSALYSYAWVGNWRRS